MLVDIDLTQKSGQTSQTPWIQKDNKYTQILKIQNTPTLITVEQEDNNQLNYTSSVDLQEELVKKSVYEIFDLDFNLNEFYKYLEEDPLLKPSIEFCHGLRLFHAINPLECILASISSANNSIKRWTQSIQLIKDNYGESITSDGITYSLFPDIETLTEIPVDVLKSYGLGYRVPYIQKTLHDIMDNPILLELDKLSYPDAYEEVIKLSGVGPKVADCILLYGFHHYEVFPVDVWINRIISYLYFNNEKTNPNKIRQWGMEKFDKYAGYVQLYLFHYARKSGLLEKIKK